MTTPQIKNVVFDVGNVLVRWSPSEIVRLTFNSPDSEAHAKTIFQNELWRDLNKGLLTEAEAKLNYQQAHGLSVEDADRLFYYVKHTQLLIYGSVELLTRVKQAGYGVYALTDNVVEIVEHLQSTYDFWPMFDGATVSADVGLLKPQPEIYESLLTNHTLAAAETVFIDDMPHNVTGAQSAGMSAIQFKNADQCEQELKSLGLLF